MRILHNLLARSDRGDTVDLGAYLQSVALESFRTQLRDSVPIQLRLNLMAVQIGLDQSLSCGLLVQELIANCLQHAFPGNILGEVWVDLTLLGTGDQLCLRVQDTGVGLPVDFATRRPGSIGLDMSDRLARQLGVLEGRNAPDSGAIFSITFPWKNPAIKNPAT